MLWETLWSATRSIGMPAIFQFALHSAQLIQRVADLEGHMEQARTVLGGVGTVRVHGQNGEVVMVAQGKEGHSEALGHPGGDRESQYAVVELLSPFHIPDLEHCMPKLFDLHNCPFVRYPRASQASAGQYVTERRIDGSAHQNPAASARPSKVPLPLRSVIAEPRGRDFAQDRHTERYALKSTPPTNLRTLGGSFAWLPMSESLMQQRDRAALAIALPSASCLNAGNSSLDDVSR